MSKALRKSDGTFAPGWRGGGRPPGARNKLGEIALATLTEHFAEHGKDAIDTVYREKPHVYLQVVASLLPKQMTVERLSPLGEMSDGELELLQQYLAMSRAKLVRELEQHNGSAIELEPEAKRSRTHDLLSSLLTIKPLILHNIVADHASG
jgi:hypothetical protein